MPLQCGKQKMFPLFLYYKAESFNALQQFSMETLKAVSRILPATSWAQNISKISKSSWKRKFCLFSANFCFIETLCPTYTHNKTGFFFFSEFFLRSIRSKRLAANSCPWYPNCKDRFYLYISPEVFRCFLGEYEWSTGVIWKNDC